MEVVSIERPRLNWKRSVHLYLVAFTQLSMWLICSRGVTFRFKCRFCLEVRALITDPIFVLLTAWSVWSLKGIRTPLEILDKITCVINMGLDGHSSRSQGARKLTTTDAPSAFLLGRRSRTCLGELRVPVGFEGKGREQALCMWAQSVCRFSFSFVACFYRPRELLMRVLTAVASVR